MSVFGKTCEELWEKYAIIGIDIDIDTREKFRYISPSLIHSIAISSDTRFAYQEIFCHVDL